ncbi:competence type IV pilus major pilin ComGC [Vagococcus elongatus]|uniref:Competence protein ComGC n=1 Tax=Vagococcus elongatus TaxID=180344 RepID=A0A430B119_9ENTE|nr:competence type IV pilus major pilin ComGC [Vagococcus elongatus]RSU14037.1 hypothetical protein CBF29_03900 [Vagococcus elongatus]
MKLFKIDRDKKKSYSGFTLIEMLIVLFIIAVLVLIFVPNLSSQKEEITKQGNEALTKVVHSQVELFLMNGETDALNYENLVKLKYLTQDQSDKAQKSEIKLQGE